MNQTSVKGKAKRKLSRAQIVDILERNSALYKDEENFVLYLIELTVYLLEYEYDWAESGHEPAGSRDRDDERASAGADAAARKVFARIKTIPLNEKHQGCPYCGTPVGDLLVCPFCRNLTR